MTKTTNTTLVVFIDSDWDCRPYGFTRKRLLLALAEILKRERSIILCVQRPIDLVVAPIKYPGKVIKYIIGQSKLHPLSDNMFLLTPWMIANERIAARVPILVNLNKYILGKQINKALNKLGIKTQKRTAWIFHPYQKDMIGVACEEILIYECYDEYGALIPSPERERIKQYEDIILANADIVLTTAKMLYETRKMKNAGTYLVQNGVDYNLFAETTNASVKVPDDIKRIPTPRIGYAGAINGLLDFNMINSIASRHPEWSFVFLGPNNGDNAFTASQSFVEALHRNNIYFIDNKPYDEVPQYLKSFQVCIIPYLINDCTTALYPLKLNEYLAAGKLTVCTDFVLDLKEFDKIVWIADSETKFEKALIDALKGSNGERIKLGKEVAKCNSWQERATSICNIFFSKLNDQNEDIK